VSDKTTTAPTPDEIDDRGRLRFECWGRRKAKTVSAAEMRQAQILHGWPDGKPLTETQFDAAIDAARKLVFR